MDPRPGAASAHRRRAPQRPLRRAARAGTPGPAEETFNFSHLVHKLQYQGYFSEMDVAVDGADSDWMCPIESCSPGPGDSPLGRGVMEVAFDPAAGVLRPRDRGGRVGEQGEAERAEPQPGPNSAGTSGTPAAEADLKTNDGNSQDASTVQSGQGVANRPRARPRLKRSSLTSLSGRAKLQALKKKSQSKHLHRAQWKKRSTFSNTQNCLIKEYMAAHLEDFYGPNRKGTPERLTLWLALTAQINVLDGQGKKSWKQVQKRWLNIRHAVVEKAMALNRGAGGALPGSLPLTHNEKLFLNTWIPGALDGKQEGGKVSEDSHAHYGSKDLFSATHTQPIAASPGPQRQPSTAAVSCVSGPCRTSELRPACQHPAVPTDTQGDLSSHRASEPMAFTATDHTETETSEPVHCGSQEGVLSEILSYCQSMFQAIQRLDQKIGCLQSDISELQKSNPRTVLTKHPSVPPGADVYPIRTSVSMTSNSGLPMPRLVPVCYSPLRPKTEGKRPSPLSPSPSVPSPPQLQPQGPPGQLAHSIVHPVTSSDSTAQAPAPARTATETQRRTKKTMEGTRGKANRKTGAAGQLFRRASHDSISRKKEADLVRIGNPEREVRIPASILLKASGESSPRSAVRLLLRAAFSTHVLTSSDVTGDAAHNVSQLDPNRIAAIRECLAEIFPNCDLGVLGKDWASCVVFMNNIARGLRSMAKYRLKSTRESKPKAQTLEEVGEKPGGGSVDQYLDCREVAAPPAQKRCRQPPGPYVTLYRQQWAPKQGPPPAQDALGTGTSGSCAPCEEGLASGAEHLDREGPLCNRQGFSYSTTSETH
ncbi:uncharacterized protein LOC136750792 isoform X2 [Amia ocellicauda]|uniref:uncharacterized protein LOC136750792 isoform X2 n=1 Tax=Amia ocellicauda TaxID=2972642 RepID=UPI00346402A6